MPRVLYIESDGKQRSVDVPVGWTVMEGAVQNQIPGIVADCGGSCACGTCHVYVSGEWLEKLSPKTDEEISMLDFSPGVQDNSRLSCRLTLTEELNGLVVTIPKEQV